jgi:hypothetical protein
MRKLPEYLQACIAALYDNTGGRLGSQETINKSSANDVCISGLCNDNISRANLLARIVRARKLCDMKPKYRRLKRLISCNLGSLVLPFSKCKDGLVAS